MHYHSVSYLRRYNVQDDTDGSGDSWPYSVSTFMKLGTLPLPCLIVTQHPSANTMPIIDHPEISAYNVDKNPALRTYMPNTT